MARKHNILPEKIEHKVRKHNQYGQEFWNMWPEIKKNYGQT